IGEQEGAAFVFRHAADELPTHQRMQLRVFVDRPIDPNEQTFAFQRSEMVLEIEARAHFPLCRGAGEFRRAVGRPCRHGTPLKGPMPAGNSARVHTTMERSVLFAKTGGSVYSIRNACMELAPGVIR